MSAKWYRATTSMITLLKDGRQATYVQNDLYQIDLKDLNKDVAKLFVPADDPSGAVEQASASPGEKRASKPSAAEQSAARKEPIMQAGEGLASDDNVEVKVSTEEL